MCHVHLHIYEHAHIHAHTHMSTHTGNQRPEIADTSLFMSFSFILSGTQTWMLAILRLSVYRERPRVSVLTSLSDEGNACLKTAFTMRKHLSWLNCLGDSITTRQTGYNSLRILANINPTALEFEDSTFSHDLDMDIFNNILISSTTKLHC